MTQTNKTEPSISNEGADTEDLKQRRIRSFVLRQGRLTKGQERALETGLPVFGIPYADQNIDLSEQFKRTENHLDPVMERVGKLGDDFLQWSFT